MGFTEQHLELVCYNKYTGHLFTCIFAIAGNVFDRVSIFSFFREHIQAFLHHVHQFIQYTLSKLLHCIQCNDLYVRNLMICVNLELCTTLKVK